MKIPSENFKTLFQSRLNKNQITVISALVGDSKELFDQLITVITHGKKHEAFMASWVLGYAGIKKPEWFYSHLPVLLKSIEENHNESVLRNVVRVMSETAIPHDLEGLVTQKCVDWAENKESSIAVKAFSFHVLSKIIEREPGLCGEIKDITESVLPYASKGLANSAEKLLKKIRKMGY